MGNVAILGDLSGHLAPMVESLKTLGIVFDEALAIMEWPRGLTVVQVGDLIHKGPDSDEIISFVDYMLHDAAHANWVQLMGNHESQYYGAAGFWPTEISEDSYDTLLTWLHNGKIHAAACVTDNNGDEWFVSHGGLNVNVWSNRYSKLSAADIAQTLNRFPACIAEPEVDDNRNILFDVFAPGVMLAGHGNNNFPGVIWAEARMEVRLPWIIAEEQYDMLMPFHQVHGHSSALTLQRGQGFVVPDDLKETTSELDNGFVHTVLPKSKKTITGIDPGATKASPRRPVPFVIEGGEVTI